MVFLMVTKLKILLMSKYVITGKDKQGKAFTINTDAPHEHNIKGATLWINSNEISKKSGKLKRKKLRVL